MKILLFTLYFDPDVGANAVIMTELAEELVSLGHKVTVVTAVPHYADNVIGADYKGKLIVREQRDGLDIIRTYLYSSPKKDRFWARFLNYVSFNLLSTFAGLYSGPQDIILAPSPPLTIGLSAWMVGLVKRIPFIYNVQDINPDVLIKLGILTNRVGIAFSRRLELFVYRRAKHISVLSEGFKDNLTIKKVPPEKITIIPNFIDTEFLRPGDRNNSFEEFFNLQGKLLVLYAGNLGHSQNIEIILECASMASQNDDIQFVIVGNGSRKQSLQEKAKYLKLKNVVFIPFQPRKDVPLIYAAADISLITLKSGIALDSVPSKAYTIMASSRPVVATVDPGSDIWKLIQEANCGICVPPESPFAFMAAITELCDNPALRDKYGQNGRRYVEKHHTRRIIAEKYQHLLEQLFLDPKS